MYSACKLNKQGDSKQPWCIPFPIWNQSIVPCPVLTVTSWPEYRFLRRQVRWSGIVISLSIFHSLLWSTQSRLWRSQWSRCFLEFSCFFYDPTNVGNLTSVSSAFSKSSLYIWKFSVHVLLKPSLEDFAHHLAGKWNKCNCAVVSTSVLPLNIQDWFPLGLTCWISLQPKGHSRVFSNIHSSVQFA